ncbi:MAG: sialidase family protein [Planctomycetia bacterium]|nr:sialidase family protein [Planctomycetia bacterium]
MKKTILAGLLSLLASISFSRAAEVPNAEKGLQSPQIFTDFPAELRDENRIFQGIPSLAATGNGQLWAVWYTGGETENQDNVILVVRSRDGGRTWSKPLFYLDGDGPGPIRLYDPAMWCDPTGRLWVFWAQGWNWWDGRAGVWAITTDNPNEENPHWSAPRRLCDGIMMCKPFADSKNVWHLPASIWNVALTPSIPQDAQFPVEGRSGAGCVSSADEGKTWTLTGKAFVPRKNAVFDEHCIVEKKDGTFWALVRTKGIGQAFSQDRGKTWTDVAPIDGIRHTSSRPFLRRLASGNLILVKHGEVNEDCGRKHLKAFLSDDDGKTWKGGLMLDERSGVSYPDGDQTPDGSIYIIYDFDRYNAKEILLAHITEADILAGKIVSPQSQLRLIVNKATGKK